jgi:hypothetical protein
MAYYHLFPQIDTTIYSHPDRKNMNTGGDEILEIIKERGTEDQRYYPSRILMKFKNEELLTVIEDIVGNNNFNNQGVTVSSSIALKLHTATPQNLSTVLNLELYALAESWNEGKGRYLNFPTSSGGATWIYRDGSVSGTEWTTSSFAANITGSIIAPGITEGGASWYTGSGFSATQTFYNESSLDTNFDITSIVQKHSASAFASSTYPNGIVNNGFIIKQPYSIETNTSSSFGQMSYFSLDTHTIYPPKMIFKWDDSIHNSQSIAKQNGDLNVSLYRNQEEYNQNDEAVFRVHVRDKYPTRQFASSSNHLNTGYFTTSSYYSIRDAHTEEEVIPFDNNYTKLSADSEGMYFKIYMKGLQPERYYRVLFKHKNNEGIKIYDNKYHFKVVR